MKNPGAAPAPQNGEFEMTNPPPSTSEALLHAILSMDSYNRGYDAAVLVTGSAIGDVTVLFDSSSASAGFNQVQNLFGNYVNADQHFSFYAVAYSHTNPVTESEQKIISYRGTDNWDWIVNPLNGEYGDPLTGFPLATNDPIEGYRAVQADMALGFYQSVVGVANVLSATNVSLTGHSLGGGLAGFVGGMYEKNTIIFDHMPYEDELREAKQATNFADAEYNPVYKQLVYGSLNVPTNTDIDETHQAYYIYDEILSHLRSLPILTNNTDNAPLFLSTNDEELDLIPFSVDLWDILPSDPFQFDPYEDNPFNLVTEYALFFLGLPTTFAEAIWHLAGPVVGAKSAQDLNEEIARHSQSTMVLRLSFEKQDEDNAGSDPVTHDWKAAGKYLWPSLYDNDFADVIGAHQYGVSNEREQYADIMRTVLAYSAIESNTGLVFGNTGARALHSDATDFGRALSAVGAASSIENSAKEITKAYVHYATDLAVSKVAVDLEGTNQNYLSGILDYDDLNPDILTVNFNTFDWFPMYTDLKETMAVTRDALVEAAFFDYWLKRSSLNDDALDLDAFIKSNGWLTNLSGETSGEVFNRVIFAALESGSSEEYLDHVGEYYKGTLYIGATGDDTVKIGALSPGGNHDQFVFIGNGGDDTFWGGEDSDIAIGGDDPDALDGRGDADFLYGGGGPDALKGGTGTDIVIGGTGNDVFIADADGDDIYHGGYDQEELAPHWNVDPFDMDDLSRQEDGLDKVDYTSMDGVAFEVTLIDASLGNYFIDKYYSGTLHSGTWDRDVLYSIEILDIDVEYLHEVGGAVHMGDSGNNSISYVSHGGGNYNVAYSFYGYGGIDTLWGGNKNDLLVGGADNDTLSGNDGNDTYVYNLGDGADTINDLGNALDYDTIMFGIGINPWETTLGRYHTDKMTITFVDQSFITVDNQNSSGLGIDYLEFMDGTVWDMQGTLVKVYGTEEDDNLAGTAQSSYREGSLIDDVIYAGGGSDYVNGYGGNDTIYGGDGDDQNLFGDYGDDVIYGEGGSDLINGGNNNDSLYGGAGNDTINGGNDNDLIFGHEGADILKGDSQDDTIYGGDGDDTINGGNGVDSLYGEADNDTINGDNGNDIIYGGGGNDTLIGGTADAGNDILVGGDGNDSLYGYGGADTLYGGAGLDTMSGGLGADTFVFEAASAFSNIDVITDFKQSESDKLDISDILEGYYDYGVDVITDFVQITQSGATAYLSINQNGSGGGGYVQIATLTGLGSQILTDEAALEASGRLVTHV